MKKIGSKKDESPAQLIDAKIDEPADWRGVMLSRLRALIKQADPEMIEERKWRKPSNAMAGVPVWSHDGIVCTGETYKAVVKLTFAKGAVLPDPSGLFNSSLDGNTRRAIDIREGEAIKEIEIPSALARGGRAGNWSIGAVNRPVGWELPALSNPFSSTSLTSKDIS